MPGFDGIGANEYIVDVTYPNTVDFISTMDTPYPWELNIWYHTLNVGFRTRISGETDFPCITDARVGQGRVYAKVDGPLSYKAWLDAVREGRSYVSDGRSHLMDFRVNGIGSGNPRLRPSEDKTSELDLAAPGTVHVTVKAAAMLDVIPHPEIHDLPADQKPYFHIERARIGDTREVPVELIVNGQSVARKTLQADGVARDRLLRFADRKEQLGCPANIGLFPYQSHLCGGRRQTHTRLARQRPVVPGRGKPVLDAEGSEDLPKELPDAVKAYEHARAVYKELIQECSK